MMPKEEEEIASTISSLKFLSIWEEGETASPLMDNSSSPLHDDSNFWYKSRPQSPSSSPIRRSRKRQSDSDYELKNARDALVGSISAVVNFLRSSGIPKPRYDFEKHHTRKPNCVTLRMSSGGCTVWLGAKAHILLLFSFIVAINCKRIWNLVDILPS
jgi:hypothetical protein